MTIPHPEGPSLDPAFPDVVDDASPERALIDDPEEPALPGDDYVGVLQVGTTTQEQIDGESLNRKIAREVPDTLVDPADDLPRPTQDLYDDAQGTDAPAGRLVDPGSAGLGDNEADEVAVDFLVGESDASPEEAAMHVRDL